jgi:hypothetical protein
MTGNVILEKWQQTRSRPFVCDVFRRADGSLFYGWTYSSRTLADKVRGDMRPIYRIQIIPKKTPR